MATQMEYLHMQMPMGGLWGDEIITGVPVKLTAMHSDGSYVDIGAATTDGYYGTYGLAWTPPEEGTYKIIANFHPVSKGKKRGRKKAQLEEPAGEGKTRLRLVHEDITTWYDNHEQGWAAIAAQLDDRLTGGTAQ